MPSPLDQTGLRRDASPASRTDGAAAQRQSLSVLAGAPFWRAVWW